VAAFIDGLRKGEAHPTAGCYTGSIMAVNAGEPA